jgi:hypothetical protein
VLNKLEKAVMVILYDKCANKESALISPRQIIISLLPAFQVALTQLEKVMNNLVMDGYIDVINSTNKGNQIYCVSLKMKGIAFKRDMMNAKKQTRYLLRQKILLAIVGVTVTLILRWLLF